MDQLPWERVIGVGRAFKLWLENMNFEVKVVDIGRDNVYRAITMALYGTQSGFEVVKAQLENFIRDHYFELVAEDEGDNDRGGLVARRFAVEQMFPDGNFWHKVTLAAAAHKYNVTVEIYSPHSPPTLYPLTNRFGKILTFAHHENEFYVLTMTANEAVNSGN